MPQAIALRDDSAVQRLAAFLALNHLHVSLGAEAGRARKYVLRRRKHIKSLTDAEVRPRVVFVIGAGASYAFSGIPLGSALFHDLRRLVPATMDELYERNVERLTNVYRLDENHLETKLLALSAIDRQATVEAIRQVCGKRYFPSFGYESIAHLMKHRFVDATINFNFDELLDQALDDEMEPGDYRRVVLDGDCPDDLESIIRGRDRRFDLPVYIKPHGTAGNTTSLRYTREHYFQVPSDVQGLLNVVMSDMPTAVVVIGFAMASYEFREALQGLHPRSELFVIDPVEPDLGDLAEDFDQEVHHVRVTNRKPLDAWLEKLCVSTERCFAELYQPRHLQRHRLIASLFAGRQPQQEPEPPEATETYLRDRTVLELTLAIAKSKGFVNLKDLARDRAGKYFERYSEVASEPESLYKICRVLGMSTATYSRYAMRFGETNDSREVIVRGKEAGEMLQKLKKRARGALSADPAARLALDSSVFEGTLGKMYDGGEVEISPQWARKNEYIFHRPESVRTQTAMSWETRKLIGSDWNTLLVVAETGQWLLGTLKTAIVGALDADPTKRIGVIVADTSFRPDLLSAFPGGLRKGDVRVLPWWLHNQHMTLALRDGVPRRAVFFTRRLRSARISPMVLRDADAGAAFSMFSAYWEMAGAIVEWPDFTPAMVAESRTRLVGHFRAE